MPIRHRRLPLQACLFFALLAGCITPQPDLESPSAAIERANRYVQSQNRCATRFKARLSGPSPDRPASSEGKALWVSPGIVYVRYLTSERDRRFVFRADQKHAWVYHDLVILWVSDNEMGMPGAGRGLFSISDALAAMSRHAGEAVRTAAGAVKVLLTGADLEAFLAGYPDELAYSVSGARGIHFARDTSEAELELFSDAEGKPRRLNCKAVLRAPGPFPEGPYPFDLEVEVVDGDPATGWDFFDQDGAGPPTPEMKSAMESTKKSHH